jgi:hypothetical protein
MARVMWLLNRCSAALLGALAVGVITGAAWGTFGAPIFGPTCIGTKIDLHGHEICAQYATTFAQFLLYSSAYVSIMSSTLGMIPCTISLMATPARKHPWRALVALVPATVIGFVVAGAVGYALPRTSEAGTLQYYVWLSTFIVIPTAAAILVAINFNKLPRRLVGA